MDKQEQEREQFEQLHGVVRGELLDAISGFEGRAGTGLVAYVLLSLGCQLSHDCCPEDEHWMDLVTHVIAQTDHGVGVHELSGGWAFTKSSGEGRS